MIQFPKCRIPTITFGQILRVIKSLANACANVGFLVAVGAVGGILVIAGRDFFVSPEIPLLAKVSVGGLAAIVGGKVTAWAADR